MANSLYGMVLANVGIQSALYGAHIHINGWFFAAVVCFSVLLGNLIGALMDIAERRT